MAKNKLLTIPIEEEKRERLNKHCADAGTTVAQFITKYIDAVLDSSIDTRESIDPSRQSIDIEVVVTKVIDRLRHLSIPVDPQYVKTERFNEATHNLSIAIAEVKNSAWLTECSIQNLKKFVDYQETGESIDTSIEQSTDIDKLIEQSIDIEQPIDTSIEQRTLEDTERYLRDKNEYNRSRSGGQKKISQTDMAVELNNYQYPHPQLKPWTRIEVSKVCKLWKIITA